MEILDGTVLVTALPAIARDLAVSTFDVGIAISAYLITVAVVIPVSGWVVDRFTARPVYLCAIALFAASSIGCALSVSLPMLVGMRVLQGVGGALMVPVGRLVVLRAVGKPGLVRAIAWLTWPALVAPVVAPLLGGLITSQAGWRWIFAINVPIGVIGLLVGIRLMPRSVRPTTPRPLDVVGAALVVVSVTAGMVALDAVRVGSVSWTVLAPSALTCAVGVVAAWRHLSASSAPLLGLGVLRVPTFTSVLTFGSCYRAVISAVPFLLPLMFQLRFGWSPTEAGAAVTALFAGNVLVKPVTTPLMRVMGIRRLLLCTIGASVAVLGVVAAVGPDTPWWMTAAVLVVSGALRSIGFTAYNTLAFADVNDSDLVDANTLHASAQELFAGVGVGIAVVALSVGSGIEHLLPFPAGEFGAAYVLLAALLAVCGVGAARLPQAAAAHVTARC